MLRSDLALGIDLGTSGVRIAILNQKEELIYSSDIIYPNDLSIPKDWEECTSNLIKEIPESIKKYIRTCAIDGTSGTLLACNEQGRTMGKALPYHICCPEQTITLKKMLPNGGIASNINSSLARALHLRKQYGHKVLLRHQADWITGWFLDNWSWGEAANNFRLGWDPEKKQWPKSLTSPLWKQSLPVVVESGTILSKIANERAKQLDLPRDLLIIAGTTDSNAAFLSANIEEEDGLTVLGSTIVVKRYVKQPIYGIGITNHLVMNRWICGGASNAGGNVLRQFFSDKTLQELSQQIDPEVDSGLKLRPLPFKGERFPVNDPNLEPILEPRPVSDALYLHGMLEGLARIESQSWQKLIKLGAVPPKKIITIGGGAKNPQWRRIRERITGYTIKSCNNLPAIGTAQIALNAISIEKH